MEKTTSVYLKEHRKRYFIVSYELKYFNKLGIEKYQAFENKINFLCALTVVKDFFKKLFFL